MKTFKPAATVTALLAASTLCGHATFVLTLDDGINPTVSVSDNIGSDLSSDLGRIVYFGGVGVWSFNVDVGSSKPALGSSTDPQMSLVFSTASYGAGTLTITLADDGFGPLGYGTGTAKADVNGTLLATGGMVTYSTWVNNATVTPTTTSGALSATFLTPGDTQSGSATGLGGSWSMSQKIQITHTGAGSTQGDASLAVVPEPTTIIAGGLLLLPFAGSTLRFVRRNRMA